MIGWREAPPDFSYVNLENLFASVPVIAAAAAFSHTEDTTILMRGSVWQSIMKHVSAFEGEAGGLLIGRASRSDQNGKMFVSLEGSAACQDMESTAVSLVMDSHVWAAAREAAAPGTFVVGWYHSHPNLGAFFSGTDRKTQRSFFANPHSVGMVVDHIRKEQAYFIGADSGKVPNTAVIIYE